MVLVMYFVLFLAFTGHSSALYCVCKDGVGDQALQKAIDYACGAGADCTPILQNGACFQPNTVKDHCNYAVNSYFQRKGQAQGSCDFSGAATPSQNPPTSASTCVYPSSPGNAGTGTTGTPTTTTPTTGTPSTLTPTTPTGTGTSTGTGTGSITGNPNVFGISPTSSTGTSYDPNKGVVHLKNTCMLLVSFVLTFLLVLRV
ncbi:PLASMODESMATA CALLOSE-BINDING PROTEIN 4-like [Vigna unguiculata]|uniref:Histidine kinase 2/3/4 n=1 Tax=Vigna unguiculata TaxID=3917 RepID=A0A4D6LPZ3_VIGUN|nr:PLASMODESMATA CALLOSE-BINDING PROTEIN 4-like [Vigna unguiculata]QCD90084.1 histidine kinase 2/3/4 [Vigna unguiculata]